MRTDARYKLDFLSPPSGRDAYGERTGEWTTTFSDVYASMEPLLGNELQIALGTNSKVEVKFRCYWFAGVTNDMHISCSDGNTYVILSAVDVKGLHRDLLIYARRLIQ